MNKITKKEFIRALSTNKSYLLMGGSKSEQIAEYIMRHRAEYKAIGGVRTCVKANDYNMVFSIDGEDERSYLSLSANGDRVEYLSDGEYYARCQYWIDSAGNVNNQLCLYKLAA